MTKESKIREISASLRLAALNLDSNLVDTKGKLIKIAQGLDGFSPAGGDFGGNMDAGLIGGSPGGSMEDSGTLEAPVLETQPKSKFGIDQEQARYYKVDVEFLYIPASDNLQAREKIMKALQSIPDFRDKFNVGEAQGMSVKDPS